MPSTNRFAIPPSHLLVFLASVILFICSPSVPGIFSVIFAFFPGLLLLAFFPGYYLNHLWLREKPLLFRVGYAITSSIALHLLLLGKTTQRLPLTQHSLNSYLLLVNLACFFVWYIWYRFYRQPSEPIPSKRTYDWVDLFIVIVPITLFLINYWISPVITEGDSYYFIFGAIDSLHAGRDISPFANRPGFIPLLAIAILSLKASFSFIFKILIPAFFYCTIPILLDTIFTKSRTYTRDRWLYLFFLAIPVIAAEVDISRTQSLIIAFTLPILLLLTEGYQKRNYLLIGIAGLYSYAATQTHELGYVFLLVTILTTLSLLCISFLESTNKRRWLRNFGKWTIIGIIFLFPYAKTALSANSFGFYIRAFTYILQNSSQFHWRWWFLDSYKTVDGWDVSWAGTQVILYYLYNGIIFMGASVLFWLASKRQNALRNFLPIVIFISVYFATAEILPRFGIAYYPNRAWVHLMLGAWAGLTLISINWEWRRPAYIYPCIAICLGATLIGIGGWVKVTEGKGGFYSPEENRIQKFMATSLPENAFILSTQTSNEAILRVYVSKKTGYLPYTSTYSSYDTFAPTALNTWLDQERLAHVETITTDTTEVTSHGQLLSETKTNRQEQQPLPSDDLNDPVYFYYSFSRLKGIIGSRDWWRITNNSISYDFFKNFPAEKTVYKDDTGIIIKLR